MHTSTDLTPVPAQRKVQTAESPAVAAYRAKTAAETERDFRYRLMLQFRVRVEDEQNALTREWMAPVPTAGELAEQILKWADERSDRVAFDPDSRRWLRYDPARGHFRFLAGTAHEEARSLIAEVAASSKRAYLALKAQEEKLAERRRPAPDPVLDALYGELTALYEAGEESPGYLTERNRLSAQVKERTDARDAAYMSFDRSLDAALAQIRGVYDARVNEHLASGRPGTVPEFRACASSVIRQYMDPEQHAFVHSGQMYGYHTFFKYASGEWHETDGHGPSVAQVTAALVDLVTSGRNAARYRDGLKAGESGRGLFLPVCSGGYEGVWNFGGDKLLDAMEYQEIPLRAAGYEPDSEAPVTGFEELLELVFPDPGLAEHWMRSTAMCFTGQATKQVLFWRGQTNRGKSLLASMMSDLLGGYARNIPAKMLFGYAADDQRAAQELVGTWMAVVEEGMGSQSFKTNEAFKAMSNGGALLNARQLYHESRMVQATHTLVLCANEEADPDFKDDAILARLVAVSFDGDPDAIIEYAKTYNPSSEQWKREAPGVLAKMLGYAQEFLDGAWTPGTLLDWDMARRSGVPAGKIIQGFVDDSLASAIEAKTATNIAQWLTAERVSLMEPSPAGYQPKEWGAQQLYARYTRWVSLGSFGTDRGECLTQAKWSKEMKLVPGVTFRRSNGSLFTVH